MPQLVPVVLTDRAPTPVDHTFNPRDISNGVVTLAESTGIPIAERRITLSQVRSSSGRVRVTVKLAVPVVQDVTVNGVTRPTLVRTNYGEMTFNFDSTSSAEERDDVVAFVNGLTEASNTMMSSFLVDLEGLF
jgi:hypothetical protein